jgi:hypothetical protein
MGNEAEIQTPKLEEFHTSKTGEDELVDRTAEEAAERAGRTEKRYDQDHDIFTK